MDEGTNDLDGEIAAGTARTTASIRRCPSGGRHPVGLWKLVVERDWDDDWQDRPRPGRPDDDDDNGGGHGDANRR